MTGAIQPITITIVEDHDLVRDALVTTVEMNSMLHLVGQACNGTEALALLEQTPCDLAIVDFALPDMTGLEIITKARQASPNTRYLILTGSPMDENERARLAKFAEGFMHKEAGRDALLSKIVETANMPPLTIEKVANPNQSSGLANVGALTKRERAVLKEIARGHSIEDVAISLGISPSTVRKHRENTMTKLRLHSTAQLVRAAMQIGQY